MVIEPKDTHVVLFVSLKMNSSEMPMFSTITSTAVYN